MSSEKFCLKWNDFERNISSAFRDIREEKEFFDITLACEDEQLSAHRVILSACSPFFKTVLRRNPHQHPLLYLKGVTFRDMQAVLNFMYHGEVNVAQDDLNSFLQVAEDLKVKGLTQNSSSSNHSSSTTTTTTHTRASSPPKTKAEPRSSSNIDMNSSGSRVRLAADSDSLSVPPAKRARSSGLLPRAAAEAPIDDDDIQEVIPVKSEPTGTVGGTATGTMAMYEDGTEEDDQLVGGGYDDNSYQEDEEYGEYGETEQYNMAGGAQDAASGGRVPCPHCFGLITRLNLAKHIRTRHTVAANPVACPQCAKTFKNAYNMKDHLRKSHAIWQRETTTYFSDQQ